MACDNQLDIPNLWVKQTDKVKNGVKTSTKYYQTVSDNKELPFSGNGYENGKITERYIYKEIVDDKIIQLEGIDFMSDLKAYASKYSLELPNYDPTDIRIFSVSVDFDGDTPLNIDYHINLFKE